MNKIDKLDKELEKARDRESKKQPFLFAGRSHFIYR